MAVVVVVVSSFFDWKEKKTDLQTTRFSASALSRTREGTTSRVLSGAHSRTTSISLSLFRGLEKVERERKCFFDADAKKVGERRKKKQEKMEKRIVFSFFFSFHFSYYQQKKNDERFASAEVSGTLEKDRLCFESIS